MLRSPTRKVTAVVSLLALAVGAVAAYSVQDATSPQAARPLTHHQLAATQDRLVQLLEDNDSKASFDYLRNATESDPAIARECHRLLHHVGQSAYKKYGDFNQAIGYQDGLCNSGYTHGVIEAHIMASSDIETTLATTCAAKTDVMTFQDWQCYHGIGHGVMYFTDKNLPQSLALCESLASASARSACANGVFMERFIVVSHSGSESSQSSDIATSLCHDQTASYKSDCYFYGPTAYLERNSNDYTGAFNDCRNAEEDYIGTCVYGVGGQSMKENITRTEVAKDVCKKAPNGYKRSCIAGAISLLINHHASTAPVEPLCSTTFAQYEDTCIQRIDSWNSNYAS